MNKSRSYFYFFILAIILVLSLFTDWYVPLLLALTITILLSILDKLGKGIVLRELIALHSCVVCLLMPWVGYEWYTISNPLARTWVRYMPVPSEIYFPFALPAIAAFSLAICWPMKKGTIKDEGEYMNKYLLRLKVVLQNNPSAGLQIMIAALIASFITPFLPVALQLVGNLIAWSAFAAILYIFFNPSKLYRLPLILLFVVFVVVQALQQGMFTIVAYMGITIFSFLFLNKRSAMWKKVSIFVISIFLLLVVQSVKSSYRRYTWFQNYQGNKIILFSNLVTEKLTDFSNLFTEDAFFPIYYRVNQGFNVALVMHRFPAVKEFDNGSRLAIVAASAVVPRFLWPDKPEAGGKFNMQYYTGLTINGYSTDVGPLGEAYGSFGVMGGIVYMFFLGLFVRWAYVKVFTIGDKIPLLILWIPVLFFQVTYSAENDTLQILNSLFKSAFLIYLIFKAFPALFGLGKSLQKKKNTGQPGLNPI